MLSIAHHRFGDSRHGDYEVAAGEYAALWSRHFPDLPYHQNQRGKYINWMHSLHLSGVEPEEGAILICGPGYNFTERDMLPEMVEGMLAHHPAILGADWSPEILDDFDLCVQSASRKAYQKTVLTQRDFSGGVASRLQSLIASKLDDVRFVDDLRNFFQWLKDIGYKEVKEAKPEVNQQANVRNPIVSLDIDEPLNFDSVLQGVAEIRFITANLLLAGMLALTESEVRSRIMEFKPELREDEVVEMLRIWHGLIRLLNTKIASDFITQALKNNPNAHLFMPTDVNTAYHDSDTYERLDLTELRTVVEGEGFKFGERGQWVMDDSHESPPHTHLVRYIVACAKGEGSANPLPASSEVQTERSISPAPTDASSGSGGAPVSIEGRYQDKKVA